MKQIERNDLYKANVRNARIAYLKELGSNFAKGACIGFAVRMVYEGGKFIVRRVLA